MLVFRVRPGKDQKIGSTKSFQGVVAKRCFWTLFKEGAAPSGKYYAKVKPTDTCQGDRSKNLKGP